MENRQQAWNALKPITDVIEEIRIHDEKDRLIGQAAMHLNLVFHAPDQASVRQRAWEILELILDNVPQKGLILYEDRGLQLLTSKKGQNLFEKIKSDWSNPDFNIDVDIGSSDKETADDFIENAQKYTFSFYLKNTKKVWSQHKFSEYNPNCGPAMGHIKLAFPLEWIRERPKGRNFFWLVKEAVRIMQPYWATAGWGLTTPLRQGAISPSSEGQQLIYPFLAAFPGLETVEGLYAPEFNHSMYTINWLSVIHDDLLEKLGGRAVVKQQCLQKPELLSAEDIGQCLLIEALPGPMLGGEGVDMSGYNAAANLLKPIRVSTYLSLHVAPPPNGSYNKDLWNLACDAYLRRFDEAEYVKPEWS